MKQSPGITAERAAARCRAIAKATPTAEEVARRLRLFGKALQKMRFKPE
jgi:hypothetical protein